VATKRFARDYCETQRKNLSAIDKATTFIQHNKEESQAMAAKRLKMDKEVTASLWNDFVFEMSLDQSLLTRLENEARWAIKK